MIEGKEEELRRIDSISDKENRENNKKERRDEMPRERMTGRRADTRSNEERGKIWSYDKRNKRKNKYHQRMKTEEEIKETRRRGGQDTRSKERRREPAADPRQTCLHNASPDNYTRRGMEGRRHTGVTHAHARARCHERRTPRQ